MIHRIDRVNPDVDDRVIKPNEARMAVNLRFGASTEDTNLSGGTLVLGNTELPFTPPAGTNKVVGVYADLESRNVFFALYNNQGANTAAQHGIYRISGADNSVQPIVQGAWLNFQSDDAYNVSITGVDGKLYWTDNVNEPRMVNVEKGIRTQAGDTEDVYPIAAVQDWFYSQIKRPPGQPLVITPVLGQEELSSTFTNKTLTNTGLQFSYYYVYDNFEESRLAPFTFNSYAVYNVTLTIPEPEFSEYTTYKQLIKAVVIVVRNGNDGAWRELVYETNEGTKSSWFFTDILTAVKNIVASDIIDARFDSVPLKSGTNEIAQNRINHGNYVLDEQAVSGVTFEASIISISDVVNSGGDFPITDAKYFLNSFVPWGRYTIGLEFVDKFGRTYPVNNTVEVTTPPMKMAYQNLAGTWYAPGNKISVFTGNEYRFVNVPVYEQGKSLATGNYFNTVAQYKIKGTLPDWVDRVNVVRSKAKNIVTMHQSIGNMYLWYETEAQEPRFFSFVQQINTQYNIQGVLRNYNMSSIYNADEKTKYTFKGYVIKFNNNEPFVLTDNLYVTIYQSYVAAAISGEQNVNNYANYKILIPNYLDDVGLYSEVVKYKVHTIDGDRIYIKANDPILRHPIAVNNPNIPQAVYLTPYSYMIGAFDPTVSSVTAAQNPDKYYPLIYNFTLTKEVNVDEQIVYVTENSYSAEEFKTLVGPSGNNEIIGWAKGDAALCLARKTYSATVATVNMYILPEAQNPENGKPIINQGKEIRQPAFDWLGTFISMSPRDIYAQQWNQNIGQINTTNYKESQNRRLPSNICFSGSLVQGTQVNGLNKFNSLDFRQAPAENGPITSLVTTNATQREPGVLLAIGTYGVGSFYYDAIQLTNVDGTNNVTTTDSYLASQRPLLGQYGTSRPMSVTKTPLGTVYWWSDVVNDLIRYTNAGLERLGNTFSFANYLRRTYNENPLLITWYDQVTDEINLLGTGVRAAVFSERYKTFQGERDYFLNGITPERAIGLPTKQFWFVNGRVWMADVNQSGVDDNFIFGAYRNPNLTIITNESPAAVKRWNQVKVFGNRPSSTILSTTGFDTITEETLTSFIAPGYYIQRKGDWGAAIRRASNTEGGLLAGKLMESRIIYSNFAFSAQGFDKLNFIEIKSNVSIVQ
jgi:hypothetical protein